MGALRTGIHASTEKGVEVLVTGLSGADDTTYYGWGTTITSWNKRFFYSEEGGRTETLESLW